MVVLNIRTVPDPVLRRKAKRVRTIDKSIQKLISDMRETLHAAPGRAGLAAPQVGVSLRVAVIGIPDEEDIILVNPEIVRRRGERVIEEGCLSIPGYFALVKRAEAVTAKALDENGREIRIRGTELLAQALEHEIDHLNGVLYVDHLEDPNTLTRIVPEDSEAEEDMNSLTSSLGERRDKLH
ncbi:MAG: peptide deformylase [Dehalococcoidales bacterium]|nr:peptide deformylase [Dehalococcoidales bacterium]